MDYKEKLEEAKRLYETANQDQRYVLESLFPELAESEDERIRKTLVEFFTDWGKSRSHCWSFSIPKILAWLEKQGEKKSQRMISAEAKEAMYDKPAWSEEDEEMLTEIITDVKFAQDEFAKDKNPQSQMNQIIFEEEINWLESIKDRVIPQPKSAWSEDDELVVEDIEEAIINYWHGQSHEDLLDWLKSIKKRIGG